MGRQSRGASQSAALQWLLFRWPDQWTGTRVMGSCKDWANGGSWRRRAPSKSMLLGYRPSIGRVERSDGPGQLDRWRCRRVVIRSIPAQFRSLSIGRPHFGATSVEFVDPFGRSLLISRATALSRLISPSRFGAITPWPLSVPLATLVAISISISIAIWKLSEWRVIGGGWGKQMVNQCW